LSAKRIVDLHHRGLEPIRGLLLGAPGAGKGTQALRIVEKYPDISILSSGDLLRDHMRRGTELGKKAKNTIARGGLVDDDTMCDLVISTIQERGFTAKSFFLDGFPRTETQAATLDNYLSKLGTPLNFVVNLDVPYSVIIDRIVNRWIHAPSGRTYNLTYNPPKVPGIDDETGEQLTKRLDDNVETFQKRLADYDAITTPLKDYYDEQGILNTFSGETSDLIWPQLEEELYKVQ
jgi:adenylate kinase